MPDTVYLDYNASAPLRPGVKESLISALDITGNPSSIHNSGRKARKLIETARENIAQLVGGNAENVIFNSGATEGNNSIINAYKHQGVLVSAIEHPCIIDLDHNSETIHVTKDGEIDLNHFQDMIGRPPPPALVSVMMVNNETGVIQPVEEMIQICHMRGVKFHTDASQAVGRIPVNLFMMNADYMTISSHKIGGPHGVGALITTNDNITPVLLSGGGQEKSKRAGTENVAGIAAFGEAAKHAKENLEDFEDLEDLQHYLELNIKKLHEDIVIYGENVDRVANTTCFSLPGASAETMIIAFDLEKISISSGSACSSGKVKESHVLKAMGASQAEMKGALRISYGWNTSREDIDRFLEVAEKVFKRVLS